MLIRVTSIHPSVHAPRGEYACRPRLKQASINPLFSQREKNRGVIIHPIVIVISVSLHIYRTTLPINITHTQQQCDDMLGHRAYGRLSTHEKTGSEISASLSKAFIPPFRFFPHPNSMALEGKQSLRVCTHAVGSKHDVYPDNIWAP